MKRLAWFAALLLSCLSACSINDGQCWVDPGQADGIGAGGGPIAPYSTGGFGDAPGKEPQDAPAPPECNSIGTYDASLFKFSTTVVDDGEGKGGGYREATATGVKFVDGRQDPPASWTCSVWVGIPIRTEKYGTISADRAAAIAADVLTGTASITMHSRDTWIPALFCAQLGKDMTKYFQAAYGGLGASARAQ